MEEPRTICRDCEFLMCISLQPIEQSPWFSMLCKAWKHERGIDPVTGKEVYIGEGGRPLPGKYGYCRDHNSGDCPRFKERVREKA